MTTQTAQSLRLSATPIPSSSPMPQFTSTPETPAATDISLLTSTISPTGTPLVLTNEVHFRRGGTSAYFQKSIKSGDQHHYSVRALKGQTLILAASSPNKDVYLDVKGVQDGQHLLWISSETTCWFGTLPKTT